MTIHWSQVLGFLQLLTSRDVYALDLLLEYWIEHVTIGLLNVKFLLLSGVPDYFDRNKISSGGDLSHYSSASLY